VSVPAAHPPSGRLLPALVDLLRGGRSLALWSLGPAERLWRRATGRPELPPLWLRRHVGPLDHFESAARETAQLIDRLELLAAGDRVVDLGCGCGAMVPALGERIGAGGAYLGLDVHAPSIAWCRRRWRGDGRLRFERLAVPSPYGDLAAPSRSLVLPLADGTADLVLAKSLFTHLLATEAVAYLAEMRRVLAADGAVFLTAFLFDGERFAASPPPAFPHPGAQSPVRWRRAARPHAAVAYERRWFLDRVGEAGLAVRCEVAGFHPGEAAVPSGQDVLVLRRAG
jgi:SAM-dependent methyltransferase